MRGRLLSWVPPLPPLEGPAWRERVLLALVLATVFLASLKPLANSDTFWHLALGREIWTTGHLVRTETFSFTAAGTGWEDTEWLFHLLAYPAWKTLGDGGLPYLVAAAVTLAAGLVYRSVRLLGGDAASFGIWLAITAAALQTRVSFRPDAVSMVFMAVLAEGLLRWSPSSPRRPGFWIFTAAVFWLWCQLHGGWVYGYALLACFTLGLGFDALVAKALDRRALRDMVLALLAPLGAVMLNPYGWRIPWFPLKHVLSFGDPSLPKIAEWQPTPWALSTAPFIAAVLLAAALPFFTKPRRWAHILWCASQVALGLHWGRYAGYAALTLAPFGARGMVRIAQSPPARRIRWSAALLVLLAWGLFAQSFRPSEEEALSEFPVAEVRYLVARGISGKVLHEYPAGGYLEWMAPHRLQSFFDGRFFPFAQAMKDYRAAQLSEAASEALQHKYDFDIALYPYQSFRLKSPPEDFGAPARGPSSRLFPADRWALVHFGPYGMVLAKRGPALDSLIVKEEYGLLRPDDLDYLTWAALQGRVDRDALAGEIRRRLADADAGAALKGVLKTALARLEGHDAR